MNHITLVKCPFCDGQTRHDRKTCYIYTNTYWCARCKKWGTLSELNIDYTNLRIKVTEQKKVTKKNYNNKGDRFSTCRERNFDGSIDTFQIKNPDGVLVGHYQRLPNKVSRTTGERAFCYRNSYMNLYSTYRIVEGCYDCVYSEDVAVLGIPSKKQVDLLKNYNLILCPDGDVWQKKELFINWFKPFLFHKNINYVEWIKNGLDPDECKKELRIGVEWNTIREKVLYGFNT